MRIRDEGADVSALAERMREAVKVFRTHADAAEASGISVPQLRNYLAGKHVPSVFPIARFAAASGFCLEWLVSGAGPKLGRRAVYAPGTGAEAAFVTSSPTAFALAAAEDPAGYGAAKRHLEAAFGDTNEQAVRGMLREAGLVNVFGDELGFARERPLSAYLELEHNTATAILKEDPAHWPMLARAAVAAQRALVVYVAPCVVPAPGTG